MDSINSKIKSRYHEIDRLAVDEHIISIANPTSLATEQFKHLRTCILELNENKNTRVIMIASPSQNEGKSVIAMNLAISITHSLKETVLLVDGDLRKPSVTKMLGISENEKGLSEYLAGNVDNLSDILINTSVSKLTILPSGAVPDNPSELLGTDRMFSLLDELKKRYSNRFIIIDTPSTLLTTDASLLAPKVDGIIIVVCMNKTKKDELDISLSMLEKGNILGVVLNKSDSINIKKYKVK